MKMIPARHTFRFAAGLALMVLIHATLLPAEALAQPQAVGVIVMPFEIHAPAELAYLKSELPEAMKQQFTEEGANARVLDDATAGSWSQSAVTHAELARLAVQTGADYLVWGSLTWIGQDFSLDVRLLASAGDRPAKVFTAVGKGVENLPGAVKKLVQDMGLTIFKREKVVEVVVEGNQRIETDAIRRLIKTKPGDVYLAQNLAEDLKAIYGMGYFDDIQIESQQRAGRCRAGVQGDRKAHGARGHRQRQHRFRQRRDQEKPQSEEGCHPEHFHRPQRRAADRGDVQGEELPQRQGDLHDRSPEKQPGRRGIRD